MYCHKLERTVAAVAWEASAKISLLVLLALSLLDRRCCSSVYCSSTGTGCCISTGCCSRTCCCCCCCCCGRCSSRRGWWSTGSHPTESWVEQSCVSSGYWLRVSHGPKAAVPQNPDGKKQRKTTKNQQLTSKKITSAYAHAPFSAEQHMGRSIGRPVKPTGRPT